MWKGELCPICGKPLVEEAPRDFAVRKCPYSFPLIENGAPKMRCHYELHLTKGEPNYERVILWPYLIESYPDNSNVYKFEEAGLSRRLVLDIPYIDLPWEDLDKAVEKIRMYVLFS